MLKCRLSEYLLSKVGWGTQRTLGRRPRRSLLGVRVLWRVLEDRDAPCGQRGGRPAAQLRAHHRLAARETSMRPN